MKVEEMKVEEMKVLRLLSRSKLMTSLGSTYPTNREYEEKVRAKKKPSAVCYYGKKRKTLII